MKHMKNDNRKIGTRKRNEPKTMKKLRKCNPGVILSMEQRQKA